MVRAAMTMGVASLRLCLLGHLLGLGQASGDLRRQEEGDCPARLAINHPRNRSTTRDSGAQAEMRMATLSEGGLSLLREGGRGVSARGDLGAILEGGLGVVQEGGMATRDAGVAARGGELPMARGGAHPTAAQGPLPTAVVLLLGEVLTAVPPLRQGIIQGITTGLAPTAEGGLGTGGLRRTTVLSVLIPVKAAASSKRR